MSPHESILSPDFWITLWRDLTRKALDSTLQIVGLLISYLILRWLLFRIIDSVLLRILARESDKGENEKHLGRLQTLLNLFKSILSYGLLFLFGVMLLNAVGFQIMPFVETAGVIGLAIGFGAQKLVKDVISGFFIIVDNLFAVGDTVSIGGVTGRVQEIGMRVTRVLDANGKLYLIANGDISTITNMSRYSISDFVEIQVAASADLNRVTDVVKSTGEELYTSEGHLLRSPPVLLGMTAFTAAATTLRISVVADSGTLLQEQMRVREHLRASLLAAEIPLA